MLKTCLTCGIPTEGTYCQTHRLANNRRRDHARGTSSQRGYTSRWRRSSKQQIDEHVATLGLWCPGWETPGHPVADRSELVCDHDLGPMCRPCNSRKGGGYDKRQQDRGQGGG